MSTHQQQFIIIFFLMLTFFACKKDQVSPIKKAETEINNNTETNVFGKTQFISNQLFLKDNFNRINDFNIIVGQQDTFRFNDNQSNGFSFTMEKRDSLKIIKVMVNRGTQGSSYLLQTLVNGTILTNERYPATFNQMNKTVDTLFYADEAIIRFTKFDMQGSIEGNIYTFYKDNLWCTAKFECNINEATTSQNIQ